MRRHHYLYGRERLLLPIREALRDRFEDIAARQAVDELGLCDPEGPGSVTHPDLTRMMYADGKVVTPLWKAKPGDTRIDPRTSELRPLRAENDAALHVTGSGEPAWGTKHVMVAVRNDQTHGRMILSVASVPNVGGEATVALECIGRVAPLLPGALGVIYDGAFRGVHLVELLRERGLLPIVPVQAASGGRHAKKPRVERTVLVGSGTIRRPDGTTNDCILYAEAGALCLGELDATGEVTLIGLERIKIEPRRNVDGTWRWYGVFAVPQDAGGGTTACVSTRPTRTAAASSTAPSTSEPSRRATPTTNTSTRGALTPNQSTARSTTAAGSAAPTPQGETDNSSTSSATRSPSTRSRSTATGASPRHPASSPRNRPSAPSPPQLPRARQSSAPSQRAEPGAEPHLPSRSWPIRRTFSTTLSTGPAPVAQGIEHRFPKPCVAGSNPAGGAILVLFGSCLTE